MLPLLPLALTLAPYLTRVLAGDRAGDAAQGVAQAVQAVTGTDDPAQAEAALAADPGLRADLSARLAEIALEHERVAAADRADARARDVALRHAGVRRFMPAALLVVAVGGLAFFGALLAFGGLEEGKAAQAAIIAFASQCLGIVVLAANFEWGSSVGSRSKDPQPPFAPGKGPQP